MRTDRCHHGVMHTEDEQSHLHVTVTGSGVPCTCISTHTSVGAPAKDDRAVTHSGHPKKVLPPQPHAQDVVEKQSHLQRQARVVPIKGSLLWLQRRRTSAYFLCWQAAVYVSLCCSVHPLPARPL
jgi:hypothetical protein